MRCLADNAIATIQDDLEKYEQDVKAIDPERLETMQKIRQAVSNGTTEEFQALLDKLPDKKIKNAGGFYSSSRDCINDKAGFHFARVS